MRPFLAVTTMLGGFGPTGVETHFNAVLRHAEARGVRTRLFTPYTGPRWVRAFFRPLKNLRPEAAQVRYRAAQSWLIESQLAALRRREREPVTIYAQCPASARAALRAARGAAHWRVVLVVHYNGSEVGEALEKGIARPGGPWCRDLERVEQEVLSRVSRIVFVSDYMRRLVNARLPAIARVPQETIMNFPARRMAEEGGSDRAIAGDLVAIGTLEPRKNQAFLLHMLAKARERGARYTLTLVGDGPDRNRLERLRAELSLGEQVQFLGFQSDAARFMPGYRAVAHAARMENCPITLIEALACGRPLLAGAVGGIPEIFHDGVEGFFWDLGDPAAAAERAIELLGNAERYAAAAAAARERYNTVFAPLPDRWVTMLTSNDGPADRPG